MGVFRLLTYIQHNDDARQNVGLAELVKRKVEKTGKTPKLICDYISFKTEFLALVDMALIRCKKLPQRSLLYGGNYQVYEKRVQMFVKAFQHLGVDLIVFVDGPLGISETELQAKLSKQKEQYLIQLQRIAIEADICEQKKDSTSVVWDSPQLSSTQVLMTLKEAGVQIIICHGEADMEIAQYARSHEEVLGILSTDTDFSIIKNCTLFPISLNQGILKLQRLSDIACEIVSPATLASSLSIEEEQLPDLSILCGNDYTKILNRQLDIWTELELDGTDIKSIAKWLEGKPIPLINYQPMHNFLLKHSQYLEAVQCSYQFYSQNPPKGVRSIEPASLFYSFMEKEIEEGCMSYSLLSIIKGGVYWRSIVRESLTLGHPSMHDLLLPVRKVMYMLLGLRCVKEFGRTPTHSFAEININVDIEDTQIIHSLRGMDSNAKLSSVFHLMVNAHELPHTRAIKDTLKRVAKETSLQMPISLRDTIMCAALLYTTKALQPPHCFTKPEISSLIVSCLTCCARIPPYQTSLLPTMRAITLGNRFLYTLKHVYYLTSLVGLGSRFPEPKDLFYLMAFIPYHVLITHQNSDDSSELVRIRMAKELALSLEAVHTLYLAISSPGPSPKFSKLLQLFSSAVIAVEDNRESLDPDISFPFLLSMEESLTGSEDSSQAETDEENVLQVTQASVVLPNQGITASAACLGGHNASKPERLGMNYPLPVFEHRDNILDHIAAHKVVCIIGETGCGKSSQIPQFIIDDFINSGKPHVCRILISQPNYMAAKSLAKRVAGERNEEVGRTVGYCSEGASAVSVETLLTYCTTEYMLENLVYKHQGECYYTHIILDEVHERSVDTDIIMLVIRKLALKLPHLKVILMSATLQGDLFVDYFQQVFCPELVSEPYFVGTKRFPIEVYFIDELNALMEKRQGYWTEEQLTAADHLEVLADELAQSPELLKHYATISVFAKDVCTNLIISQSNLGEGILVFLPGFSDISDYYKHLTNILRRRGLDDQFLVFVFHHLVPNEEQDDIFELPSNDRVHVILSNKAAESSITIPKLRMVINFGINQNIEYDSKRKMSRLKKRWCSRSSCFQREGRVGRVFEGIAVHLFTREFFDTTLSDFDAAEITKSPLAKTVLKAKQLGHKLNIPLPSQFLSQVIEPPSLLNMEAALQDLVTFGAVVYHPDKGVCEDTDITLVGKFCLSLPLDLKLVRLVLFGIFFGCPFDAIVMAASLSMYQDIFTLPTRFIIKELLTYHQSLKRSMESRLNFDSGCYSDPIMMCNMFVEWLRFRNRSKFCISRHALAKQFAYKYSVRADRLLHFESLVGEIALHVCQFIPSTAPLYKQMQQLSHVVECGGGMPYFVQPGTFFACTFEIPFCDDSVFLKALITAASPNLLICGKREHESSDPKLRKRARVAMKAITEAKFDPHSTIAMEIEDTDRGEVDEDEIQFEEIDETILQKLVKEVFPRYSCEVKTVDKIALIQLNQSPRNKFLLNFTESNQVVNVSDLVRLFWQFPEARDNWQIEGINSNFPMPFHPYCLTWNRLTVDRERVNIHYFNWRNPTGFVCKMQYPDHPIFAVASEMIGTTNPSFVFASDITILPQMPQGLLMMLAFQPISTNIELLLEKRKSRTVISAVRINSQEIKNTATYINTADIWRINKLRKALSEAMTCSLIGSTIPVNEPDIPTLLQDVLNRTDSDPLNPPSYAATSGKDTLQASHPATAWETVSPGVDFTQPPVDIEIGNKCSHYYPTFQCSLTGGQPYLAKERVLSQVKEKNKYPSSSSCISKSNMQCQSPAAFPCVQEVEGIYVKVRACIKQYTSIAWPMLGIPADNVTVSCGSQVRSKVMQPQPVLSPITQSSLQPGSDQHIAKFFIKYLEDNGGEVAITILSQVFCQAYLNNHWKHTRRPRVKLRKFFKNHPCFQIVKESSTGTHVVKLQKVTMNSQDSLSHQSPQPGSEQHMMEFCMQNLKQNGGEAPVISLWRKYHQEYRYSHHKHEIILRKLFRAYPQYFILIKNSVLRRMETVKLSGFIEQIKFLPVSSHLSDRSHKPRSYRTPTCSLDWVPTTYSDQFYENPCLPCHSPKPNSGQSLWFPKSRSKEYLSHEDNDEEASQGTFQNYCKYYQKQASKPKIKFKKFFKTYFRVTKTSCVDPGASVYTAMLQKPTMRFEQDIVTYLSPRPRIVLYPSAHALQPCQPGSSHHMVEFFIDYLEHSGEEPILFLFWNVFQIYCEKYLFIKLEQTRQSKRKFRQFFKTYPQYFKVFRCLATGLCMVKLQKPVMRLQLRFEQDVSPSSTPVSIVEPCDFKSTVQTSNLHQIPSPILGAHEPHQPGSDQHMVDFFIDFLEHNGGEVSTSILSQVFCQSYLNEYKEHWKQTQRPKVKVKLFFKTHPQYFEVVKSSTGTRVVKLKQPRSEKHSVEIVESMNTLPATNSLSFWAPKSSSDLSPTCSSLHRQLKPATLKCGSVQHCVEYFIEYLECSSGEASLDRLSQVTFQTYCKKYFKLTGTPMLKFKHFFKSYPKYFKLVKNTCSGTYTVRLLKDVTPDFARKSWLATNEPKTNIQNYSEQSDLTLKKYKLMRLSPKKKVPKVSNLAFVMNDSEVPKLGVSDAVSQLTLSSIEFYDSGPSEDIKVLSVNTPTVSSPILLKQPNLESSTTTLDPVVRDSVCSRAHHTIIEPPASADVLSDALPLDPVVRESVCSRAHYTIIEPPASADVSSDALPVLSSTCQPCATEDINLQPRTTGSIPTQSSKPGFANHMVQYFVDYLQKRSGEASITSLRRAFATYVETPPGDTVCPYPYLSKSFFEAHPQYFKLVQGCGFCTVKLSMTSADSESLTSGNAASSVQPAQCECVSASDPDPTVKQKERSDVTSVITTKTSCGESAMVQPIQDKVLPSSFTITQVPDTTSNDLAMIPSSNSSDPECRMDVRLRPISSSVVCQPPTPDSDSEGDSGKFMSTVSSTIQPCSYVPEASQVSKLQLSDPSVIKTIPHKHSKPGSEEHVIEFFIDYLKTQSGEASITSLQRKVFPIYLKRFSIDVKDLRINKGFFRSHPRYFNLIQGDGFCTVRLSRMPPDESRYDACDRIIDSAETAQFQDALTSDSEPKVKQNLKKTRDGVSVTSAATTGSHLAKAEVSMCEQKRRLPAPPDEKTLHATKSVCSINVSHVSKDRKNVKMSPASSFIPEHQYSKSGSGKTVSAFVRMPSTVQSSARQNSKPKPSDTSLTKGLGHIPPKPGSDQHMVEFFVDYLKKRGGEASLSNLLKKAFPIYVRAFPNDVVYCYLNKWFFESRPQYFELIQGPGFCTVRPSRVLADDFGNQVFDSDTNNLSTAY